MKNDQVPDSLFSKMRWQRVHLVSTLHSAVISPLSARLWGIHTYNSDISIMMTSTVLSAVLNSIRFGDSDGI